MDEPDPTPESTPAGAAAKETVDVDTPMSVGEEPFVARGSEQVIEMSPQLPERQRTESSVVEGLPDSKTERIASMRHELAELQRHLIQAQQRVATELQGRAEDAERFEALETRVQVHELDSHNDATRVAKLEIDIVGLRSQLATATVTTEELRRDAAARDALIEAVRRHHSEASEELAARSASLNEARTMLQTRDAELAARTTERENEQATRSRLERELEDQGKQHREVAGQLELQFTSLRDAKALITTYNAELAATTSERDALKGKLEQAQHELEAARARAHDVANQLLHLGQDLGDGVVTQTGSSSEPKTAAAASRSAKRSQPPPVPPPLPRAAAHIDPVQVETIHEMSEAPNPAPSRIGAALLMLGGVILGCAVTIVIMKASSSSSTASDRDQDGAPPSAPTASPVAAEGRAAPVMHAEDNRPSTASGSDTAPKDTAAVTTPTTTTTDGVLVLPLSAAGHRVYVDGRVVEVKNSRASVPCGTHEVRIGSSGTVRTLGVACGAETEVPDEPHEH